MKGSGNARIGSERRGKLSGRLSHRAAMLNRGAANASTCAPPGNSSSAYMPVTPQKHRGLAMVDFGPAEGETEEER